MQLSFIQFLSKSHDPSWFAQYPVIYFKGALPESPLLFFSLLNSTLKAAGLRVEFLSSDAQESIFRAKLQTTFLGMSSYYWLHSSRTTEKEYTALAHELSTYKGPNSVGMYVPDAFSIIPDSTHCVVDLPTHVDQKTFVQCAQFFGKKTGNSASIAKLFLGSPNFSLDTACLMMQYLSVLGTHIDPFVDDWMPQLVRSENSLFTLSTHFFGKKPKLFFELWNDMGNEYADIFWLTYWSEQLWRAYHFVDLSTKKQHGDAKKVSMRLPFSFMQRDWKQCSLAELKNAHSYIYALDYTVKNGGSTIGIQLFYSKFFLGDFR